MTRRWDDGCGGGAYLDKTLSNEEAGDACTMGKHAYPTNAGSGVVVTPEPMIITLSCCLSFADSILPAWYSLWVNSGNQ